MHIYSVIYKIMCKFICKMYIGKVDVMCVNFIYIYVKKYIYKWHAHVLLNGGGIVFWMFGEERMQNVRDMYPGKVWTVIYMFECVCVHLYSSLCIDICKVIGNYQFWTNLQSLWYSLLTEKWTFIWRTGPFPVYLCSQCLTQGVVQM